MKRLLLITALSFIAVTSCKKKGCIDINAKNYNSEAKKDDGSCSYEGSAVFWVHADAQISIYGSLIEVFVEGESIGTMNINSTNTSAPDCGTGGVNYYTDLNGEKNKIINYEIKYSAPGQNGETDFLYKSGSTKINGGMCQTVEIN